jgi:hypothetical protein
MSERDFAERLGDELTAAARRQAERRAAGWRGRLPRPPARLARGRALLLIGAVALVGAGGTAGLLAARGEVGGPPSLTFARISPQQRAAGVKPLTRPVVFARGHLAYDHRPWQLVGFQTTRGLCIEIDFPRQDRAGGCGSPVPRAGRALDWQAQIAIARLSRGLVLGAVDPAAATVRVRHGVPRPGVRFLTPVPNARQPMLRVRYAHARTIHVREPRLLAAMGVRRPFAYWLAELDGQLSGMLAEARDAHGALLGRAGIPQQMGDTSGGIAFQSHDCRRRGIDVRRRPRLVATLPPAAVRERIAALRRPQRPDDLPPRGAMRIFTGSPFTATVELDAIRLLRQGPDGERFYLVPTTERPFELAPPSGCLRTLTPHQREREAALQRRVRERARALHLTVYAIAGTGPRFGGGAFTGFDLDAYRHGHAMYGSLDRRMIGMAPDGVASVELRFRDGSRQVVQVVGNVWTGMSPHSSERARAVIWHDAHGRVLRRLR